MYLWSQTSIVICDCEYIPFFLSIIIGFYSYFIHIKAKALRDILSSEYSGLWFLWSSFSHPKFIEYLEGRDHQEVGDSFSRKLDKYDHYRRKTFVLFGICLVISLISMAIVQIIGLQSVYYLYSAQISGLIASFVFFIGVVYSFKLFDHKGSIEQFISDNEDELADLEDGITRDYTEDIDLNINIGDLTHNADNLRDGRSHIRTDFKLPNIPKSLNINPLNILFGCSIGVSVGFLIAGIVGSVLLGILGGLLSIQGTGIESIIDRT